jgi:hypothetical protein
MKARCPQDLMIVVCLPIKSHMKVFYRISIALVALSGLVLVSCNDAGRTPQPAAKPQISRGAQVPVVDSIPESHEENTLVDNLDPIDRERIDSLLASPALTTSFWGRVDKISRYFLGVPFDSTGPTGEGGFDTVDTSPIYNIHRFDCLTYVEHVLALALSSNSGEFISRLVRLRYKDGIIDYAHRNHFFVIDWLANNGDIAALIRPQEGIVVTRTISKKDFFGRKGLAIHVPDTLVSVNAWSVEGFMAELSVQSIGPGIYIIGFIKKRFRRVITNHVGFAVITPRACILRDANKTRGRVCETDLVKYLDHYAPLLEGVLLVRIGRDFERLSKTADSNYKHPDRSCRDRFGPIQADAF